MLGTISKSFLALSARSRCLDYSNVSYTLIFCIVWCFPFVCVVQCLSALKLHVELRPHDLALAAPHIIHVGINRD